jgi:hypothetical protein
MEYSVGDRYYWIPMWLKWDEGRDVVVKRVYPRGRALMDNGVICDENGFAMIYDSNRTVGRVVEIMEGEIELPPPISPMLRSAD